MNEFTVGIMCTANRVTQTATIHHHLSSQRHIWLLYQKNMPKVKLLGDEHPIPIFFVFDCKSEAGKSK